MDHYIWRGKVQSYKRESKEKRRSALGCTNVLLIALVSPPCDVAGGFSLAQKCLNTTMLDTVDTETFAPNLIRYGEYC